MAGPGKSGVQGYVAGANKDRGCASEKEAKGEWSPVVQQLEPHYGIEKEDPTSCRNRGKVNSGESFPHCRIQGKATDGEDLAYLDDDVTQEEYLHLSPTNRGGFALCAEK